MRVVIVEDDTAIRISLADVLTHRAITIAGTAANLLDGIALVGNTPCDFAIVDIDLGGNQASPLIELLEARNIPFVTITGLMPSDIESPRLRTMSLLTKPFDCQALMAAIDRVCAAPPSPP